jgi:hypothetical protein
MSAVSHDQGTWLPYAPRHYFRDAIPADPHHVDTLRARDLEIFTAHGEFCRHVVPNEFHTDAPLTAGTYVVVSFVDQKWRRAQGDRDGTPKPMGNTIRPRRRATGRRRG